MRPCATKLHKNAPIAPAAPVTATRIGGFGLVATGKCLPID